MGKRKVRTAPNFFPILIVTLVFSASCGGKSSETMGPRASAGGREQSAAGASSGGNAASATGPSTGSAGVAAIAQAPTPCEGGCMDTGLRPSPLPRPSCPLEEPQRGDPCSAEDLLCGYGDAPTPRCREYYRCQNGGWTKDPSLDQYPCVMNTNCPDMAENLSACTLETAGVPCAYPGLLCFCATGKNSQPGARGYWNCYGPPMNSDCPATLPNIGEGCAAQGLECHYAVDGCSAPPHSTVFCREGAWEDGEALICSLR
jgi:hypothetical protein